MCMPYIRRILNKYIVCIIIIIIICIRPHVHANGKIILWNIYVSQPILTENDISNNGLSRSILYKLIVCRQYNAHRTSFVKHIFKSLTANMLCTRLAFLFIAGDVRIQLGCNTDLIIDYRR